MSGGAAGPVPTSIPGRFLQICEAQPETVGLRLYFATGEPRTWTYADLADRAARWSALYRDLTRAEDRPRVFIVLPHSVDLYASFLGALMAGVVPAILAHPSPKTSPAEYQRTLTALFKQARPAVVATTAEWRGMVRSVAASTSCRVVTLVDLPASGSLALSSRADDDVAFVQYSSGTTGLKKGVAITHRAALWQADHYGRAIHLAPSDRIASWLPLYHDMGLITCGLLPLVTGTPLAALSPFDWVKHPISLLEVITAEHSTLAWLPNFAYNLLAQHAGHTFSRLDLQSVRALVNCSEPVLASSHRVLLARLRTVGLRDDVFATSYAMAESTFAVTSGGAGAPLVVDVVRPTALAAGHATPAEDGDPDATTLVSSGAALPETTIRIVDGAGAVVADRVLGEILVQSPSLFDRYDGSTASALHDGWFATGDLGYLSAGQLFVTGRKKDLIIIAGKNLFPQDVEAIVNSVHGVIAGRAVAFGIADEIRGTERLVVVAETNVTDVTKREAIRSAIRERLAEQDLVAGDVRLVPHKWLRKSTSGKLARGDNRDKYLAEVEAERGDKPGRSDARERHVDLHGRIADVVRRHLGRPDLLDDDRMITSGLVDSLGLVDLVFAVETAAGIEIPPTDLDVGHFETITAIVRLVEHIRDGSADPGRLQEANRVLQLDDRDKACRRYLETDAPIDCLVLGSSKAKQFWPGVAAACGHTAFNFWLMSARAEDWYCALRFVLDHPKATLRTVVLLVDVEGFSNAAGIDIRLAYSTYLTPYLPPDARDALPGSPPAPHDGGRFDAISVQFKLGETEAWMLWGQALPVTDRVSTDLDPSRRRPTRIDDPHDRDSQYTLRMAGFTALDPTRVACFRALVALCEAQGIRLVCAISPLHPVLDAHLTNATMYGVRLEEFKNLVEQMASPTLSFLDTRVPDRFGGDDLDFLNGAHIGLANSDRLFETMLRTAGASPLSAVPAQLVGPQATPAASASSSN